MLRRHGRRRLEKTKYRWAWSPTLFILTINKITRKKWLWRSRSDHSGDHDLEINIKINEKGSNFEVYFQVHIQYNLNVNYFSRREVSLGWKNLKIIGIVYWTRSTFLFSMTSCATSVRSATLFNARKQVNVIDLLNPKHYCFQQH